MQAQIAPKAAPRRTQAPRGGHDQSGAQSNLSRMPSHNSGTPSHNSGNMKQKSAPKRVPAAVWTATSNNVALRLVRASIVTFPPVRRHAGIASAKSPVHHTPLRTTPRSGLPCAGPPALGRVRVRAPSASDALRSPRLITVSSQASQWNASAALRGRGTPRDRRALAGTTAAGGGATPEPIQHKRSLNPHLARSHFIPAVWVLRRRVPLHCGVRNHVLWAWSRFLGFALFSEVVGRSRKLLRRFSARSGSPLLGGHPMPGPLGPVVYSLTCLPHEQHREAQSEEEQHGRVPLHAIIPSGLPWAGVGVVFYDRFR